jgi:hypothetical protein
MPDKSVLPENFRPNPDLQRALAQIAVMQEYLCDRGVWVDYSEWLLAKRLRVLRHHQALDECWPHDSPCTEDPAACRCWQAMLGETAQ